MRRCDKDSGYDPIVILYEYPFNERTRTYLRLEHLFRRLAELVSRTHPLDHHFAIQTIFEIMDVGARSDLKTEILKDLDRHKQLYNSYRGNPAISEAALDQFIARLDACFNALHEEAGKVGHALMDNEWLMSVRSRITIPGGTCEFDLPAYHDWQHRPAEQRQQELVGWTQQLAGLAEPVQLLMALLRENGLPQKVIAQNGQYQQNLPQGKTYQLLRFWLDPDRQLIPEISGNRLMFSVRLMQRGPDGRLSLASEQNAELEVTLCA